MRGYCNPSSPFSGLSSSAVSRILLGRGSEMSKRGTCCIHSLSYIWRRLQRTQDGTRIPSKISFASVSVSFYFEWLNTTNFYSQFFSEVLVALMSICEDSVELFELAAREGSTAGPKAGAVKENGVDNWLRRAPRDWMFRGKLVAFQTDPHLHKADREVWSAQNIYFHTTRTLIKMGIA